MTSGIKRDPSGPFGVLLADLLDERGMSYGHFAARVGVDRTMVTRTMVGERVPTVLTLDRMCKVLKLGPRDRVALYVAAAETATQRSEAP
jgi:transcriptional regulator with XRE-family HTH domain